VTMQLTFNGKPRELVAEITLEEFLNQLRLDCLQVVVELNGSIVSRQRYAEVRLADGDRLEVVHFVGGG